MNTTVFTLFASDPNGFCQGIRSILIKRVENAYGNNRKELKRALRDVPSVRQIKKIYKKRMREVLF